MCFLVLNVSNHSGSLGFTIRKCSKTLLPFELILDKIFIVDPLGRVLFNILHQIREGLYWPHSKKNMKMIGHSINSQQFVALALDNACYVFIQFIFPFFLN